MNNFRSFDVVCMVINAASKGIHIDKVGILTKMQDVCEKIDIFMLENGCVGMDADYDFRTNEVVLNLLFNSTKINEQCCKMYDVLHGVTGFKLNTESSKTNSSLCFMFLAI